jgi:hypothetical protein
MIAGTYVMLTFGMSYLVNLFDKIIIYPSFFYRKSSASQGEFNPRMKAVVFRGRFHYGISASNDNNKVYTSFRMCAFSLFTK